jgi:hypothetical protein
MTPITLDTLRKTQEQLVAMRDELKELQGALVVGDASVLDRHKLVMEQIRELKESFVAQRDALSKALPDGRRLYTGQYEALEKFASNNKLDVQKLFSGITIEGGVVVECNFERLGLTTLEGLEGLQRIRTLNVYYNAGLTSLKGIPTKALETQQYFYDVPALGPPMTPGLVVSRSSEHSMQLFHCPQSRS